MEENNPHYLSEEHLIFKSEVSSWQEAIKIVAQPLLAEGIIEKKYIDAMIQNVMELGDYMVLVPKVAMPHARPEAGALRTDFSILKLEHPVLFGKKHEVSLIICLATIDNKAHLALLQRISALIDEEVKVNALLGSASKKEFVTLAETFIREEEEEL